MGKGRILTAHGEGRYTIEILEDRTRAESRKTTAEQRVTQIDSRISELETDLATAQGAVDSAAVAQDQAIADYQAALGDDQVDEAEARQAMVEAGEAIIQAAAKRDAITRTIRTLEVERLTLQARIDQINALPPLRQQEAWCADYVEDLSGEVATAEVPGEIGQVIIKPGYSDSAAWSPADDGAIQPALSGTPASVFYNLAMMPGWQRWRPTFRIATISNIAADLCDISLDPATSSQQGLNVNAQGSYSGVPIMYMDCNGDAFEDGDRVLVAFSGNTDQPMVVGFEKEPKECAIPYSASISLSPLAGIDSVVAYAYEIGRYCDSTIETQQQSSYFYTRLGAFGSSVGTLPSPGGVDEKHDSGDRWKVSASLAILTTDHAISTAGASATYSHELSATAQIGDPLTEVSVFDVLHQVVGGNSTTCEVLNSDDGYSVAKAYRSLFDQSTLITIDGVSFDLSDNLVRVAGSNFISPHPDNGEFVNARYLSDNRSDTNSVSSQRDSRGVIYWEYLFSSVDIGQSYSTMNDYNEAVKLKAAAFLVSPSGDVFQVQAKSTFPDRQLPGYESFPVDIKKNEDGVWTPVYS